MHSRSRLPGSSMSHDHFPAQLGVGDSILARWQGDRGCVVETVGQRIHYVGTESDDGLRIGSRLVEETHK